MSRCLEMDHSCHGWHSYVRRNLKMCCGFIENFVNNSLQFWYKKYDMYSLHFSPNSPKIALTHLVEFHVFLNEHITKYKSFKQRGQRQEKR